jgi:hypothetical protein
MENQKPSFLKNHIDTLAIIRSDGLYSLCCNLLIEIRNK